MSSNQSDSEYSDMDDEPSARWIYENHRSEYKPLFVRDEKGKKICVRKIRQPNHKYKRCKKELIKCNWCSAELCPSLYCINQYIIRNYMSIHPSKEHEECTECSKNITCCPTGICENCEIKHRYDLITDTVAIGSYQASYEPFDIIVNLDYPHNKAKKGKISEYVDGDNKHIIMCGFDDCTYEGKGMTKENVRDIIQRIQCIQRQTQDTNHKKILFHCYAGVSRSPTVAMMYLLTQPQFSEKSVDEIYVMVQKKRPRISPNEYFREHILETYSYRKNKEDETIRDE